MLRVGISFKHEKCLNFEPTMPGSSVQCLPELGHRSFVKIYQFTSILQDIKCLSRQK